MVSRIKRHIRRASWEWILAPSDSLTGSKSYINSLLNERICHGYGRKMTDIVDVNLVPNKWYIRGSWGNAKNFEFERLKGLVLKDFRCASLLVAHGSLGYWLSNAQNIFGKVTFCWVHELKMQKCGIFGIASTLWGKGKNCGNCFGAKPKIIL